MSEALHTSPSARDWASTPPWNSSPWRTTCCWLSRDFLYADRVLVACSIGSALALDFVKLMGASPAQQLDFFVRLFGLGVRDNDLPVKTPSEQRACSHRCLLTVEM